MIHRSLIISAAQRDLCAELCAAIAGPAGEGMFTTALTDDTQVTHYISSGYILEEFAAVLPLDEETQGDPDAIVALANQVGFSVTLEQVNTMLSEASISDTDPHTHMAKLNLKLKVEEWPDPE